MNPSPLLTVPQLSPPSTERITPSPRTLENIVASSPAPGAIARAPMISSVPDQEAQAGLEADAAGKTALR